MSKYLLLVAVVLCGCSSATEDLRPFVAVAGRYSLMTDAKPAPAIQTDCSNCRGTGIVGDSRIAQKCPVCKGTGKVLSSAAPCKDGTCPPSNTSR
jgi:RecJ-like exonuclease